MGFCVKNKSLSSGQHDQFKYHKNQNECRCPDPAGEWTYISFSVNGEEWKVMDTNEKLIFYFDLMREKLKYASTAVTDV